MNVKVWGVRGSLPAPMHTDEYRARLVRVLDHARTAMIQNPDSSTADLMSDLPDALTTIVGGETTCVEVRNGNDQLILDMGTGARRLGYDMMARGHKGDVHILVTHTHWDHIQGWPFFVPGYIPDNTVHFYSCHPRCRQRFVRQQNTAFFPVRFDELRSKRIFHEFKAGETFAVSGFTIDTAKLKHPGGSTAYRIRSGGKTFIFATDTEFFGTDLETDITEHKAFFEGADLLVMDAQYSLKEAEQRIGWGHTAMVITVDCAIRWNVKRLVLTHHEPAHADDRVRELFADALEFLKNHTGGSGLAIELALEEQVYEL